MNKQQRKELAKITSALELLQSGLIEISEAEEEKVNNIPESLADTEKSQRLSENYERLDNACQYMQDLIDELQSIE